MLQTSPLELSTHKSFPYGIEVSFWEQLHSRLIPNPLSLEAFADSLMNLTIGCHFLHADICNLAVRCKHLIMERGDWGELENIIVKGRKMDVIRGMQTAIIHLQKSPLEGSCHIPVSGSPTHSHEALLSTVSPSYTVYAEPAPQTTSFQVPVHNGLQLSPSNAVIASPPTTFTPTISEKNMAASSGPVDVPFVSDNNGITVGLNRVISPFFHVVSVVKTLQLRYGSTPVRFFIPLHYAACVKTRKLRVQLLAYNPIPEAAQDDASSTVVPQRWPALKHMMVYVNDEAVQGTSWKRTWPDRSVEVSKSLLPLDITQYLRLGGKNMKALGLEQNLKLEIFSKEYTTNAAIALVESYTVESIMSEILLREVGAVSEAEVMETIHLAGESPLASHQTAGVRYQLLAKNQKGVHDLYQSVLEDEVDEVLVADTMTVSTYCPLTRLPLQIPVRGSHCSHLQCVDLQNYLVHGQRGGYWNCIICDKTMKGEDIRVDSVLWKSLNRLASSSELLPLRLALVKLPSEGGLEAYAWEPSREVPTNGGIAIDDSSQDAESDHEPPSLNPTPQCNLTHVKRNRDWSPENPVTSSRGESEINGDGTEENPILL